MSLCVCVCMLFCQLFLILILAKTLGAYNLWRTTGRLIIITFKPFIYGCGRLTSLDLFLLVPTHDLVQVHKSFSHYRELFKKNICCCCCWAKMDHRLGSRRSVPSDGGRPHRDRRPADASRQSESEMFIKPSQPLLAKECWPQRVHLEAAHYNWSDFQQCRCMFSAHVVQQLFNTVPKKLDIWPVCFCEQFLIVFLWLKFGVFIKE